MNKQEALRKIKELEQFIENCDPEITEDMIVPGAYFRWNDSNELVTLIYSPEDETWNLGGVSHNPFIIFKNTTKSKDGMLEYLRSPLMGKYEFVGIRKFVRAFV